MATLKYTVKTNAGRTYQGQLGYDIKKTVDRRSDGEPVQIVYECRDPVTGKIERVWTDECAGVTGEVVERHG